MFVPKSILCLKDYSFSQFRNDLNAGVIVGLVALPLAMAFAIASGVPPERGLYTAIVAGFIISALSGSRVQIGGPTGAFVVIVAGIVAKYGYDGLVAATLIAGVLLIAMGLFRFGSAVKFIPYPVTAGFTSGIAVIIFSGQIKDILGLQMGAVPPDFIQKWLEYYRAFPSANYWAAGVAAFTVACISFWPKKFQKVPGPIAALLIVSAAVELFHLPVETIQTRFGGVPQGLPMPSFPHLSWALIQQVFPSAVTVALLGAVESLLSAVVADGMIQGRHKSNMELVAQGAANLVSPLFGGIPATGAIARTVTNIKNGGRTPVAGMVHAVVLLLVLVLAGKWAAKIPLACLAGILVVVSYHMSEWRTFKSLFSAPRGDVAVLLTTFLLTVFIDLTFAIEAGMVLAAFLFMRKIANLTEVRAMNRGWDDPESEEARTAADSPRQPLPEGVEIYSIRGSFSFGAANKLLELDQITSKFPKVLVLEMASVLYLDATGIRVLDQLHRDCKKIGTRLVIAGIQAQPLSALRKAGELHDIGEENVHPNLDRFLQTLK